MDLDMATTMRCGGSDGHDVSRIIGLRACDFPCIYGTNSTDLEAGIQPDMVSSLGRKHG